MFCSHCGEKVDRESAFCPNCGRKIEDFKTTYPAKRKGLLQAVTIGALALILIGAIFGGYMLFFRADSPDRVVISFLKAAEEGDYEKMLKLFPREVKEKIKEEIAKQRGKTGVEKEIREGMEFLREVIREKGGIREINIDKLDIRGTKADVRYTVSFGDGNKVQEKVRLVKEEGKWKLDVAEAFRIW